MTDDERREAREALLAALRADEDARLAAYWRERALMLARDQRIHEALTARDPLVNSHDVGKAIRSSRSWPGTAAESFPIRRERWRRKLQAVRDATGLPLEPDSPQLNPTD